MSIVRTLVMSSFALGAGTAALTGTAKGSTPFTIPTSIASMQQDAIAVCERAPNAAANVGLPALADGLSTTCADAVQSVNAKLNAGLGDGGSALTVPQDGKPILIRVGEMAEGIGARLRNAN
ncbi:hypothetical protein [Burkholderia glumae]|uniref:hypothetical protein n=1 Tax=Burkholderia glumae TaxID=337 RepID=UPI00214F6FFE|nr:hypothetical protein [Burkholderia glumae]